MFELTLLVPESGVEAVSDALDALDALSVSVEDADAQTDQEQALFGEPDMPPPKAGWNRSRVVSLFATKALAIQAAELLEAQDFFAGCAVVATQNASGNTAKFDVTGLANGLYIVSISNNGSVVNKTLVINK